MAWCLARMLLATVLMTDVAQAQATVIIMGEGTSSCGTWTAARRDREAYRHEAWVAGFISGVANASITQSSRQAIDPLRGVDINGVLGWIDNYCHAHPLDLIENAAWAFINAHPHG